MVSSSPNYTSFFVKVVFVLILALMFANYISYLQKDFQVKADQQRLQELYPDILEGASTGPNVISIDYSDPIAKGSPLVFGGSHSPNLEHQDAWDQIEEVGVTSIRKDFFPENALPRDITLEDYKNNVNGVQDSKNWNQAELNRINDIYKNSHQRGMKTIGIVAYAPAWLTHSNTIYGVPKDWAVYKDIVKETYKVYRDNLDYVEIWNEPSFDFFLNLKDSNLSREEAYKQIFKTAAEAIREVDAEMNDGKRMLIGGPVSHRPFDTGVLEVILKDPALKGELDFISYHNYDAEHLKEPSDVNFRALMTEYNVENLPIFLTEWNHMPNDSNADPKNTGIEAILYTGNKFTDFLKMNLAGANYHVLEPLNSKKPNGGQGYYGFYSYENNQSTLQPQATSWRLFSNKMGLGKGESEIYEAATETEIEGLNLIGFRNSDKQDGVVAVNDSDGSQTTTFQLTDTSFGDYAKVHVYYASQDNESKTPVYEGLLKKENNTMTFSMSIPAQTIVGLYFTKDEGLLDKVKNSF